MECNSLHKVTNPLVVQLSVWLHDRLVIRATASMPVWALHLVCCQLFTLLHKSCADLKGAISRKRQVFEKIAQKSILTFHWLKIRHWNAVCACAFSYSRVDFNVRVCV